GKQMGFRPEQTVYKLDFSDIPGLNGLVVKASACSVRDYNRMMSISVDDTVSALDYNEEVTKKFLEHLVEWNLDGPDGEPLPHTMEAREETERPVVMAIIRAWQSAMVTVPTQPKSPSPNGEISEEASLELGSQSESQLN